MHCFLCVKAPPSSPSSVPSASAQQNLAFSAPLQLPSGILRIEKDAVHQSHQGQRVWLREVLLAQRCCPLGGHLNLMECLPCKDGSLFGSEYHTGWLRIQWPCKIGGLSSQSVRLPWKVDQQSDWKGFFQSRSMVQPSRDSHSR